MEREELVAFVRRRGEAVVATRGADGAPQAARVECAVTERAEIVFDVRLDSVELRNILAFPTVALVLGDGEEVTVQCEGAADLVDGPDRDRCLRAFFQQLPEGRHRAQYPDVAHVRVRPRWVRLADHRLGVHGVEEIPWSSGGDPIPLQVARST